MSVLLETSLGDIVIDLYTEECPRTCLNFLKLCKIKYYNYAPFYNVQRGFMAQTGDPSGKGDGGSSIFGILHGDKDRFFPAEIQPHLKHNRKGTVSMAMSGGTDDVGLSGSQFFITLADDLDYLDGKHTVFGRVEEGMEVIDKLNESYCDAQGRPFRDIRIRHTVILDDPYDDPAGLQVPDQSPLPTKDQLESMRIGEDEDIEEQGDPEELERRKRAREAKAQALTLEMVGDLPFAEVRPPENVLFVCKLNPVTRDEDLELIFSRFGRINSCEIIRDRQTGDSLSYAFIEFDEREAAEEAYFKMQSVLIDDRRIHVDFSQSVSKLHTDWVSKRMASAGQKTMGGFDSLQKRTKYRDARERQRGDDYDLVMDEDDRSDRRDRDRSRRSHRSRSPTHRSDRRSRNDKDRSDKDRSGRDRSERHRSDRDRDRHARDRHDRHDKRRRS
ncbi:cyclophilin-like protein [Hesseltinella vesiculosa]|uniref:Peptidyl-prolyl cis-trans isomerase n=1 Tax=Hesseltinella vesiculosa TaxID=101127 RepID=A0A1X2GVL1_9FUNG|nr:cyclophilin-like protein [Hesseltinella vesiculosa]